MDLHPVSLGIARPDPKLRAGNAKDKKTGRGQSSAGLSDSKVPKVLKDKILERDNYTCQCCGFKSQKYQEVHTVNHVASDHDPKNLITACIFCQQCFNLQDISEMRSGVLLWLPEISQIDLHHMARAIYVARISQGPLAEIARKTLDLLMERREEVKNRISTDDPYILSTVLSDYLGYGHYQARDKKLDGVRLFPLDRRIIKEAEMEFNQFPQILAYWRSKDGPFGGKPQQKWLSIYQDIMAAA